MLLAFAPGTPNFSGKWSLQQQGRNGARTASILTINQAGATLSGILSNAGNPGAGAFPSAEIYGAKVEGDTITFYVWRGSDKPAKQFYKGVMNGEEINFTVTGGPVPPNAPQTAQPSGAATQIVAKRAAE